MKKQKAKAKNWRAELKRLIAYSITGGAWFWSGYATFAICDQVFGLSLWWAKLIANLTGVTVNFILERVWVFSGPKQKRLTVVTERYFILTLVNFVIDYAIVRLLRDQFGISPYLGQFVAAAFFYAWNYVWYKYWVFGGNKKVERKLA